MRKQRQYWPKKFRAGRFLSVFAGLLILALSASATPLPFQLSISRPDSDGFATITTSPLAADEYYSLILQVNTDLTTTNWVNTQTNYLSTPGPYYFNYRVSPAQSPVFFRVMATPPF
jgi:hypothetical protein